MPANHLTPDRYDQSVQATPSNAVTTRSPTAGAVVRIASGTLFSGAREVEIEHQGAVYRLRQTSLGKLILTK